MILPEGWRAESASKIPAVTTISFPNESINLGSVQFGTDQNHMLRNYVLFQCAVPCSSNPAVRTLKLRLFPTFQFNVSDEGPFHSVFPSASLTRVLPIQTVQTFYFRFSSEDRPSTAIPQGPWNQKTLCYRRFGGQVPCGGVPSCTVSHSPTFEYIHLCNNKLWMKSNLNYNNSSKTNEIK